MASDNHLRSMCKIFLNEFIAYEELARLIDNKENGTYQREDENGVNWISDKSEAIITYALCGFANVSSLGIMLGGLGRYDRKRKLSLFFFSLGDNDATARSLISLIYLSIQSDE